MTQLFPIRELEGFTVRTWPALESRYYDGWLLRRANGYTRRANSIYPIYGSTLDIDEKIGFCEGLYFTKHADIHFKMTRDVFPPDLDALLDAKGYHKSTPTSVQLMDIGNVNFMPGKDVSFTNQLTKSWLDDYMRLNGIDAAHTKTIRNMFSQIVPQTCFMRMDKDDRVVAVGLGVLDDYMLAIFGLVTAPEWRGKGYGREFLSSLLYWGHLNSAGKAFLQVVTENTAALNLYASMGFQEVYQYWYRTKRTPK